MCVCMYLCNSSALSISSRASSSSPSTCEDMILSGQKYPILKQLRYYYYWNTVIELVDVDIVSLSFQSYARMYVCIYVCM